MKLPARRPMRGRIRPVRLLAILAGLVVLALAGLYAEELVSPVLEFLELLEDRTGYQPLLVYASFIALLTLLVASGIPTATPMAIASGLLFGLPAGAGASLAGTVCGSLITYLLARRLPQSWVRRIRANRHFKRLSGEIESDRTLYLILLRIMPVLPIAAVNVSLSLLPVSIARFLVTTTLGLIPSMLVYAGVGTGLGSVVEAGDVPLSELITDPEVWVPLGGLSLLIITGLVVRGLGRR